MYRFAQYASIALMVTGLFSSLAPRVHAQECVYGQGAVCQTNAACQIYEDGAKLCVDGTCQAPCDDGSGNAVPGECSLGETCVPGISPGVGLRHYCRVAPFTMDLNLLDSCIYYFVEDIEPDLNGGDNCSLAHNLNTMLDRDGVGGHNIYDVDLCIKAFREEQPCDEDTQTCEDGQAFCVSDDQCGVGLFCNTDLFRCERECGIIRNRAQNLLESLDRQCAGALQVCDYTRGRCETVDISESSCSIDRECPHGAYCLLGQCEAKCYRNLDCPGDNWYCTAGNVCAPRSAAGGVPSGFDPKQFSIQFAQRDVRLDALTARYDVPLLIMDLVEKKQVANRPNVVFGYRLEATYSLKQDPKCQGDLSTLPLADQEDCVISPEEEFVTLESPFGTLYGVGDPHVSLHLNEGATARLSPGHYQATVTAIFNNGVTSSASVSFEKTSPSGEYTG